METNLSPDLFLFQRIVIDMLDCCKKNLRISPFDQMNIQQLVQSNKKQQIDLYHQHFLVGLGNSKTREYVSKKYDQLIRDNLINKDYLPPNMVTSIINARQNVSSTASSGSGSVGSALSQQINLERSVHLGKLIATIISSTLQPSSEIISGLNFLLEGTRNKTYGSFFYSLMQEVYTGLSKYRQSPTRRFVNHFMTYILNQVEYHQQIEKQYLEEGKQQNQRPYDYIDRTKEQKQKKICIHLPPTSPKYQNNNPNSQAKFGKCFICEREANNYDKTMYVPLCSMDCKNKLKSINEQCLNNDHFSIFKWLLSALINQTSTDEIVYSLFLREFSENNINEKDIINIFQSLITNIASSNTVLSSPSNISINNLQNLLSQLPITNLRIIQHTVTIFTQIFRKSPLACLTTLFHETKIFLYEIIRFMELLPITNSALQLNILKSLLEILQVSTDDGFIAIKQFYIKCDCQLFQYNIVQRIFNIVSQYAVNTYTLITGANLGGISSGISASNNKQQGTIVSMSLINSNNNINNNYQVTGSIVSGGDGNEFTINCLQNLLLKLCKSLKQLENLHTTLISTNDYNMSEEQWSQVLCQKSLKNYLQTDFIPLFNKKPVKSLKSLAAIPLSPQALALFFWSNLNFESKLKKVHEFVNKASLGELFGNSSEKPQELYKHFLSYLNPQFQELEIDDCLRIAFNIFSLPKQAQQIEIIFNQLSLVLQPYLGMQEGEGGTATYQWIMAALMVQTSTNPNVKEKQKLKLEDFKGLCSRIKGGISENRVIDVYSRVNKRPLQHFMDWKGKDVFTKKYITDQCLYSVQKQVGIAGGWKWRKITDNKQKQSTPNKSQGNISLSDSVVSIKYDQEKHENIKEDKIEQQTQKKEETNKKEEQQQNSSELEKSIEFNPNESIIISDNQQKQYLQEQSLSFSKIKQQIEEHYSQQTLLNPLSIMLTSFWEHLYVSLVNKNNLKGLQNICVLYGRSELKNSFESFFNSLYRIYKDASQKSSHSKQQISSNAMLIILHLAIQNGNYVLGANSWLNVIKIIYKLDEQQKFRDIMRKYNNNSYYTYQYESSDKLFTRSLQLKSQRLKEFIHAMCEFSSSQFKTEKKYTRQMYILHHITEIIQYNLLRLRQVSQLNGEVSSLFQSLWPTVRFYFRSITMHPRREISLAAIDSYKQLTMKILKKPFNTIEESEKAHDKLLSVYLYTFERSPSDIRDFVISVLLNIVSKDLTAGWEHLFNILDTVDCGDKTIIMKVIERLIKELGLQAIGSIKHLHSILVKELRLSQSIQSNYRSTHYRQILKRLWEVTKFINQKQLWMNTLESIKDIYKSSSNNLILKFFYQLCNYCWVIQAPDRSQTRKQIYKQILDTQIHVLELKNKHKFNEALYLLCELRVEIILQHMGSQETTIMKSTKKRRKSSISNKMYLYNNSDEKSALNDSIGFLSLWEMFITGSSYVLQFCKFLSDIIAQIFQNLVQYKKLQNFEIQRAQYFRIILLQWTYKLFTNSLTDQILKLCEEDKEMDEDFKQALNKKNQIIESNSKNNNNNNKIELIEFSVSSKQYGIKSSQQLIYIDTIGQYFEIYSSSDHHDQIKAQKTQNMAILTQQLRQIEKDILLLIAESYKTACHVNDRPFLRNFLCHNDFFNTQNKESNYLPGLMKQEFHSYKILCKYLFNWLKNNQISQQFGEQIISPILHIIPRFYQRIELYITKKDIIATKIDVNGNQQKAKSQPQIQKELFYQDISLWLSNCESLLMESVILLNNTIAKKDEEKQGITMNIVSKYYEEIIQNSINVMHGVLRKQTIWEMSKLIQIVIVNNY